MDKVTETVYEYRAWNVQSCAEKLAQESRGVYGCHPYTICNACVRTFEGYEYWSVSGFKVGKFTEPVSDEYATRHKWILIREYGKLYYRA